MEKRKLVTIVIITLTCLGLVSPYAVYVAQYFGINIPAMVLVYASTTDDTSSTILQWMPTIITFAMLGMVLGLLKKLGKF